MFRPKISVLMPVYNGEPFLKESIESILDQTFKDFEFIIIDDGSTDNTFHIIIQYAKIDNRIKLFQNKENKKIVYTLNNGLINAASNIIARMDCGDIALANRLEKQYNFLNENRECILVGSQVYFKNLAGEIIHKTNYPCDDKSIRKELFFRNNIIMHPAAMFRRVNNVIYRDFAYLSEDYDLWLRLSHLGRIAIINEYLMIIRINPYGISFSNRIEQIRVTEQIHQLLIERLKFNKELSVFTNHTIRNRNISYGKSKIKICIENLYQKNLKKIITLKKGTLRWIFLTALTHILYPQIIKYKVSILLGKWIFNFGKEGIFIKFLDINPIGFEKSAKLDQI